MVNTYREGRYFLVVLEERHKPPVELGLLLFEISDDMINMTARKRIQQRVMCGKRSSLSV